MVLTLQRRQHDKDDSSFPTTQLFILALCRVAEPIALTSILPYAFPLVKSFRIGHEDNAAFYAGILISSFALSESLTGFFWGAMSDRYGRRPILLLGCAGTMLSMLLMGFATNFWMALFGRALGGSLNATVAIIQTMVGELVKRPEHEPRAYAVMPFVWSIGTICGPMIGGLTSNPHLSFPSLFPPTSLFAIFPYLLPNLICAGLLLISMLIGYFFLHETHPDMQPWSTPADLDKSTAETPLVATAGSIANAGADLRAESYGTFNRVDIQQAETWVVNADGSSYLPLPTGQTSDATFTRNVVMLVLALGIFSYHGMTYDHLLPIFLQDSKGSDVSALGTGVFDVPGGLGLSTQQVGAIMAVNGVIALVVQLLFPLFAAWLGVWKLFLAVTILHPIAYFIVPFLALLPGPLLYPGIYLSLTVRNVFSILAYPILLILLKEACPKPSALGKINGLAASVAAGMRTLAPPISGLLYAWGTDIGFTGIAWWGSGFVALLGAVQLGWVKRQKNMAATVRMPCVTEIETVAGVKDKEVVRVVVVEV